MTRILITLTILALATGCANTKKDDPKAALSPAVADISPAPTQVAYAPPAQQQPVVYDTAQQAQTPSTVAGGKYTVRRGDTLWKIAATHYGSGSQWQKIAAANPGLAPETLKAGQTIVIP